MFSAKEDSTVAREQVKRLRALVEEYEQAEQYGAVGSHRAVTA